MDKLKAWAEDPKNMPKVIAVFGIALALAAFIVLKSMGVIGGGGGASVSPDMGMPPGQTATDMSAQQAPPTGPAGTAPAGQTSTAMPTQTPAPNAAAGAAPASGGEAAAASTTSPMLPYRKDPFVSFGGKPTQKDIVAMFIPRMRHPRIAPAPVVEGDDGMEAAVAPPPQPFRRMAGVLWNGKVSAIMETNGETDIVRPGMELSRGGSRVRVESITPDSIILRTLDTKAPMTITVGMAGSVTGNSVSSTATSGGTGPNMMQNGPY